jgi:hypothetical protein
MAEQDFDINIKTVADLTGVRKAADAIAVLNEQAKKSQAEAAAAAGGGGGGAAGGAGGLGSAAGVGTIILGLREVVRIWERFEDEQDKIIEKMVRATERSHELGLAVADMLDAMKSAERIDTEPLEVSFERLKEKVIQLKTEMKLAFEAGEYEDVKKLAGALGVVESQLDRVTNSIDKQKAAADRLAAANEKAAEKEASAQRQFGQSAFESASPQAKAILRNEEAARAARAAGRDNEADLYTRSAEAIRSTATPNQREEAAQLQKMDQTNGLLRQIYQQWQ